MEETVTTFSPVALIMRNDLRLIVTLMEQVEGL